MNNIILSAVVETRAAPQLHACDAPCAGRFTARPVHNVPRGERNWRILFRRVRARQRRRLPRAPSASGTGTRALALAY